MANHYDIAHRFANKLEGKYGCIKGGNTRYEGRNYFSYSTVFGQWLDLKKNVVAVFDGSTSMSSSKHKLSKGCFPNDVHVFPLDFGGSGYYGWHNCNLISSYYDFKDEDFKEHHRMKMIDHYIGRIYDQLAAINGGTKKGLEYVSFKAWDYVEELCSLYKDTSIAKYLKWTKNKDYKKLVKLLKDGERNVETLTDALFGEGTYKMYWDYCARFRKAAEKRNKVETLCRRLGIKSPYEDSYWQSDSLGHDMRAEDIRKLSARERNEWHFAALAYRAHKAREDERKEKYNKNRENAFKWVVGYVCDKRKGWYGYEFDDTVTKCRNMFTGDEYDLNLRDESRNYSLSYWANFRVLFHYDDFRKSEDKQQWIADFYAKCEEVAHNIYAVNTLIEFGARREQRGRYSFETAFVLTDDVIEKFNGCAESLAIVEDYIRRQDKYYEDEAARERAREMERLRKVEEERKEREYMEQVKQEQIQKCIKRGVDGYRDLWRLHYMDVYGAESQSCSEDFFYGGNVLLRFNLNKDGVETSKNVRIAIDVCKKFWNIILKWHENPNTFKPMEIDTKGGGRYTISSYENDILTAGCHDIAFTEMERMYNEIQGL